MVLEAIERVQLALAERGFDPLPVELYEHYNETDTRGKEYHISPSQSEESLNGKRTYRSELCQCDRILDAKAGAKNGPMNWCNRESTLRGPHQNVVSYIIYGNAVSQNKSTRYFLITENLPKLVDKFYPGKSLAISVKRNRFSAVSPVAGWRMYIYHNFTDDQSIEHKSLCRMYCENENVDLCSVPDMIANMDKIKDNQSLATLSLELKKLNPKLWRYLPMMDPQIDRLMARDMDSEVNSREVSAVHEWLDLNKTFHVMRDHPGHKVPIMAGNSSFTLYNLYSVLSTIEIVQECSASNHIVIDPLWRS